MRCAIAVGDWMVFLSSEPDRQEPTIKRYRFVAALRVEAKLRHTSLFDTAYRSYLNLLIRPNGAGWEHFEPALHPSKQPSRWHDDWLWRICCQRRTARKDEVVVAGRQHVPGEPLIVARRSLPVAENYIIFSKTSSILVREPPLVATYRRGDSREKWETDPRATKIRELVFGDSDRGLRTSNQRQPHRHFRRRHQDANWPDSLSQVLAE